MIMVERAIPWPDCAPLMIALARTWTQQDWTQAAIRAELERRFPDMPYPNCYDNVLAEGVMQAVRAEQAERTRRAADLKRLAEKGLPAHLADKGQTFAPAYCTCAEDPSWRGPTDEEAAAARTAGELLDLCARYDLLMRVDEAGLVLSRRIDPRCGLVDALRRHKPDLIALSAAREARQSGKYD